MVTANLAKAHVLCHLLKEGKALCQGIDEGETHSRIVDLQRQSWKSRSRSHIGNRPIMEALFVIDSQGINHMLYRHFFRVCNGCQVKEAICLQEFILIDFKTPERFVRKGQANCFGTLLQGLQIGHASSPLRLRDSK